MFHQREPEPRALERHLVRLQPILRPYKIFRDLPTLLLKSSSRDQWLLHLPFLPEDPEQFRQWTSTSQRNMVRILSRGTSGDTCLLRKELPFEMLLVDVLLRSNIFPLQHSVQRRGPILDALYRIYMGFYFGPHHLIMDALLYFEEKVHKKKLQRPGVIPLLFPRLLCHVLEHMGYPTEPHLKRHNHCREHFTLDQWT